MAFILHPGLHNGPLSLLSRRSFLHGLTASTAWTPLLLRTAPLTNSGSCFLQSRGLLSPGLEKFSTKLKGGSDQFLCERYAADLDALLAEWSATLCRGAGLAGPFTTLVAADLEFVPFDKATVNAVRAGNPIRVEEVQFQADRERDGSAFLKSLTEYISDFKQLETVEFLITALHVTNRSPVVVEIALRYDLVGLRGSDTREERVGTWRLTCQADRTGHWQIKQWLATTETRSSVNGAGFVDVTDNALSGNIEAQRQFAHGLDYWRSSIDGASGIDVYGNNGVAVGDFDGDGRDGFYVCQPSGLPNRLFRNRGDGTFEDVTAASGLGLLDGTSTALFADFTNSGTQDLIVVRSNGPLLYLNRGSGRFELKSDAFRFAKPPLGTFTGVAAADYDRDGFLDVYFCLYSYYQGLSQYTHPKPYYDAQNGPPNFLMKNRGDGTFEDVTLASGMNENNNRYSFACGWCDYDNNGWPDLYVANDFGRKNLYRNNGNGTFQDVAKEAGVEDFGAGMSVSWFDYDNDGKQDLYVTDMFSAAGARVTSQEVFLPGVDPSVRTAYQKHAGGNSLFHNQAPGALLDSSSAAHVGLGRWSWSGDAWDFDHDGNTDLYVVNGFLSGAKREDLASFFWRQIVARSLDTGSGAADYELAWNAINELIRSDYSWNGYERSVFFHNNGNRTFAELSGPLGLDFADDSRAFALADFDGDGRLELLLKNRTGPQLRILRNDLQDIGNSITFVLHGNKSNRDAIGARVTVEAGPLKQVKFVQAGSGFLSQHTKTLSFGLGSYADKVSVLVQWPSGAKQQVKDLPVQQHVTIREGQIEWNGKPFAKRPPQQKADRQIREQHALPDHFESWLIEPLPAFEFSLPSLDGRTRTLNSFAGHPLLLVIIGGDCDASRAQMKSLSQAAPLFARRSVNIAMLHAAADANGIQDFARSNQMPFPILLADPTTAGIYSILYRFLFDRRREIETPVLLFLDANQSIFKVDQGRSEPGKVLADFASIPRNAQARLSLALPFPGHFHGEAPHRNFFTYGIAFVQNDYPDAALVCFKASVSRNPNYAPAHYNLGTIYLNKQMLPEAKASLEKAVVLDPNDADAWTNLGAVAGQQNDYDTAYRYFEQAIHVRPTHLIALQNLVMLDRSRGQMEKAEAKLKAAIAAEPEDPEFHFALGMLLAGRDMMQEARVELERAVQLRPNDPISLNNLGVVCLRLQKLNEASHYFERCIGIAPDYDRPFLNLASIYQGRGDIGKAQELLKTFLARHPENAELTSALQSLGH